MYTISQKYFKKAKTVQIILNYMILYTDKRGRYTNYLSHMWDIRKQS